MVDLSMANWQCHNQRVVPFKATKHCHGTSPIYFDVQGFPRRGFPMLTIFTYQRFLEISISTLTIKFWASYHVKITTFYPSFPSHELSRWDHIFAHGWSKSPFFGGPQRREHKLRKKSWTQWTNHQPMTSSTMLDDNPPNIIWLVVYLPLWKIWKSVGIMIPNIWKNKNHVPNHQPVLQLMRQFHQPSQPLLYASEFSWTDTTTLENCSFRLSRRRTLLLMLGSLTTKRHKRGTKDQHIPVIPRLYL